MTTTTTRPQPVTIGARPTTPGGRVPPPRLPAGRPPTPRGVWALAVVLVLGGGAAAGALALAGDDTVRVVAAARPLAAGAVIGEEDLRGADLSASSGLPAIRAVDAGSLLGQSVLGPIPEGALLHPGMVASAPPPADGQVAVGLSLAAGRLPAPQLTPGRAVVVYQLPGPDGGGGDPVVLVGSAVVLSVAAAPSGDYQVTVVVDAAAAAAVSAAGAAGQAALGLLPVGAGG